MRQIKNIKSIQVFNAVARTRNLTHAARELNVSQSSVSYHIKKIEDEIGAVLFDRRSEGLKLTSKGATLAGHVERGLASILTGLDEVIEKTQIVRLAVLPMFASRWLSARLGSFWEDHPELQLTFQNHNNNYVRMAVPTDFADFGVQWGLGNWPDFDATRLWTERMVVVCSPQFLKRQPIKAIHDILDCPLLHVDDDAMWAEWFSNAGLDLSQHARQTTLEDRHFQLSSTINGLGVSLFAERLIQSELRSGLVINPFDRSFDTAFAYYLVVPTALPLSRPAGLFREWLLAVSKSEAAPFR